MWNVGITHTWSAIPCRRSCLLSLPHTVLLLIFTSHTVIHTTEGGICWTRQGRNGRCTGAILDRGVSKEDCCSKPYPGISWSEDDWSDNMLFYYLAFDPAEGVPRCSVCKRTCDNVKCMSGYKCKMRRKQPKCVCAPDCSKHQHRHRHKVCGIDARTYRNYCSLLKYNCRYTESIVIDYYGPCKPSCSYVQCDRGKQCLTDQNDTPHCIQCVVRPCTASADPSQHYCGSNGVSYPSVCHYRQAKCLLASTLNLQVAHNGSCSGASHQCGNSTCPLGYQCLRHHRSGQRQCVMCDVDCTSSRGPVCASDGHTHDSSCHLRLYSCSAGVLFDQHPGQCHQPHDEEVAETDDDDEENTSSGSFTS